MQIRHLARTVVSLAVVAPLVGCSAMSPHHHSDIEVASVQRPETDLSGIDSFAWAGSMGAISDPTGHWTAPDWEIAGELEFLIERELRARDIMPVVVDPDVFLTYAVLLDVPEPTEEEIAAGIAMDDLTEGAILVQLMDAETLEPLWRGAAAGQGAADRTDAERRERLACAIKQLFGEFPR